MNMLEAARRAKTKDFFYASSACVYNESKQEDPANPGLAEADAWPARPQDMYGLEKLYAEEMALAYGRDFPMNIRIARFHNIYGPQGTWTFEATFEGQVSTHAFQVIDGNLADGFENPML